MRNVPGKGGVVGTARHEYATKFVKRYQGMYGDVGLETKVYKSKDGMRSFLDVRHEASGRIWDWKFGDAARMSAAQSAKYAAHYTGEELIPLFYRYR